MPYAKEFVGRFEKLCIGHIYFITISEKYQVKSIIFIFLKDLIEQKPFWHMQYPLKFVLKSPLY
jgi:hypothetical protein